MEEAAIQIEEKYTGLADEAEQKTKKLKKLWKKFQEVSLCLYLRKRMWTL
jgi:kinesin family protein 3/17